MVHYANARSLEPCQPDGQPSLNDSTTAVARLISSEEWRGRAIWCASRD